MNSSPLRHVPPLQDVRFAVVGCGNMGRRHCQFITALPGASLVAVYDRTPQASEGIGADLQAYASYEELLSSPAVDAVVICLPSAMHAEFGIAAAQAGKHVVVEKPIDSSTQAGRALIDACRANGVLCAVISQNRFAPGIQSTKSAIERGFFGDILIARASVKWYRHDSYYAESEWRGRVAGERGGVLINQAIHSTDTLTWLLGPVTEVFALTAQNRPAVMETEDTAVACLRFSNGTLATLEATTSAAPGFHERYEIHGTAGAVFIEKGEIVHWSLQEQPPAPDNAAGRTNLFEGQYRNILSALRGEEPLLVAPEEALRVTHITEAYYISAREHRPVFLNEIHAEEAL